VSTRDASEHVNFSPIKVDGVFGIVTDGEVKKIQEKIKIE